MKYIIKIIGIAFVILLLAIPPQYATQSSAGSIISGGDSFITTGEAEYKNETILGEDKLENMSDPIYNILMVIGIIVAVAVGIFLGIKFITSSLEGKAEVKALLVPYVVGCAILFGAFTIWKLVVTILQS